jgi:hypothetical protein
MKSKKSLNPLVMIVHIWAEIGNGRKSKRSKIKAIAISGLGGL